MKRLLLVGLLLYSTLAPAQGYGPPPNWDSRGQAYPEGRYHHPPPPHHYEYRRNEIHEYRRPYPAWTCNWSGRYGWDCRVWYTHPPYHRW